MNLTTLEKTLRTLAVFLLAPACAFAAKPKEAKSNGEPVVKESSHRLLTIILEDGDKEVEVTVACAGSRHALAEELSRPAKRGNAVTSSVQVELSRPEFDFKLTGSFQEAGKGSILLTFQMAVSAPDFEAETQGTAFLEHGKPALAFKSGNHSVVLLLEKPE
ncbi:MAG: hypothetical protein VCA36_05880 [Opitutales bacterium]